MAALPPEKHVRSPISSERVTAACGEADTAVPLYASIKTIVSDLRAKLDDRARQE